MDYQTHKGKEPLSVPNHHHIEGLEYELLIRYKCWICKIYQSYADLTCKLNTYTGRNNYVCSTCSSKVYLE